MSRKKGGDSEPREQNQKTTEKGTGCPTLWNVHYHHTHSTPGTVTCHLPPRGFLMTYARHAAVPPVSPGPCGCTGGQCYTHWPELTPTQNESLGLNPMPLSSQTSGLTPCTPSLACSWGSRGAWARRKTSAQDWSYTRGSANTSVHADFGTRH